MGGLSLPSRRDHTVRTIAAAWRRLTTPQVASRNGPGEPTLIACSGGGDSSALVIALAVAAGEAAPDTLTVAHVLHDLRPPAQARADRDRAAQLARAMGLPFVETAVKVRALPGNAEANARGARYDALTALAHARGLRFIATAHNSHDAAESVIMALLRGAGPRGLAGIAPSRRLGPVCRLIRPMLEVSPSEARSLCTRAGWTFAYDATNDDPTRLRNAVRAEIIPRLLALRPGAEHRIVSAAARCKEAADVVTREAKKLAAPARNETGFEWPRTRLRAVGSAVLGETLRRAVAAVGGRATLDRLPARSVEAAVRLIVSKQTDPKTLRWSGVSIHVTARSVRVASG